MKCQRCSAEARYIVDMLLQPAGIPLWGIRLCDSHTTEIETEGQVLSIVTIDPLDQQRRGNER